MSEFYEDSEKLTFDRASVLVERYIRRKHHRVSRVTSKDVATEFDVTDSRHNLIRLNTALDERLPVARESGAKATQYQLDSPTNETGTRHDHSQEAEK